MRSLQFQEENRHKKETRELQKKSRKFVRRTRTVKDFKDPHQNFGEDVRAHLLQEHEKMKPWKSMLREKKIRP